MRKFLAYGLSALALTISCMASARENQIVRRDPGDAWPWGAELPFPWNGIQGVWKSSVGGRDVYFSFRTIRRESGIKQLRITEFTGNCTLVARGAGFEEEDRIINAVMVYRNGRTFNMTVHVFKQADIRDTDPAQTLEAWGAKTVTVMTITSMSGKEGPEIHQLHKASSDPTAFCPQHSADKDFALRHEQ